MFLATLLLLLPSLATLAAAQRCVVDLVVMNRSRRVLGDVDAECTGSVHSAPFGNWGARVDVKRARQTHSGRETDRRDGFQFSGWKVEDGWLQWNSCTTDQSNFPVGNAKYYNAAGFTEQRAWPEVANVSHTLMGFMRGSEGEECASVPNQGTVGVGDIALEVYELDPIRAFGITWRVNGSLVSTLLYQDVEATVQCSSSDPWLCSGESDWMEPIRDDDNEHVYAKLKIAVHLRRER